MQADAVDRGHADVAGDDVLDLLQLALERVVGLQDPFAVVVEHLAFRGEAEVLLAALDQQRFEPPLQRADGLADGGLRHLVDLRGLGEALGLGQVTEHL